MIQEGDRFTCLDLQQSMREICGYDIRKYIDTKRSKTGVCVGASLIVPYDCKPDEYAAICARAYGDIPSSAINLDQQLRAKGLKTTHKFSYKYQNRGLTSQQIVHDTYRLCWFQSLQQTATPYQKYKKEYFDALYDAFRLSYYYAQYLWAQNWRITSNIAEKLRCPNVSQWQQITSALLGIGFQFHPDDVYEYVIEHSAPDLTKQQFDARYANQLTFKKEMQNKFGIDTGCLVLSPQNQEKLRKIVTRTDTPYYIQVMQNLIPWHNR